jgi:hypothetical protein
MAVDTQHCDTSSKVALQYLRYMLAAAERDHHRPLAFRATMARITVPVHSID